MLANNPKISVGLPVYNGSEYLDQAIASIAAQTFHDIEIVVADNCSTDNSLDIATKWAEKDSRVSVIKSDRNLGAGPNFNRVFHATKARYFKWAACDDLLQPDFLRQCYDRMENDPDVVLAYADATEIDESGNLLGLNYDSRTSLNFDSKDPVLRFRELVVNNHSCISVFGLIRRSVLQETTLIESFAGSDRSLLTQLALAGPFSRIDEPLLLHREHAERSTRAIPRVQDRASWFDSSLSGSRVYPHWRLLSEYWRSIKESKLRMAQKVACMGHIFRWLRWGGWHNLVDDLR